jgi:hypothetical protein
MGRGGGGGGGSLIGLKTPSPTVNEAVMKRMAATKIVRQYFIFTSNLEFKRIFFWN